MAVNNAAAFNQPERPTLIRRDWPLVWTALDSLAPWASLQLVQSIIKIDSVYDVSPPIVAVSPGDSAGLYRDLAVALLQGP